MKRRTFILSATSLIAAGSARAAQEGAFEVTRSEEEWRAMLSDAEYAVMRDEKTERAGSSALNDEKRSGIYACRGCDLPLYDASTKFDSGTGWPSFYAPLPNAIGTKDDNSLFARRTEVHCRRCGSHLGHVFDDGPTPTGKRHCLNGVSLVFKAA
ncbi:peptide-methionine (R)-S-oxide reductase [Pacificibacter maritimus]|uniref:peptide-methionine (R)-S-oxide reductase n=1 Tax=Pacificibacter maritimus TaxID=762213 RepID=A0A3N4U6N8_9RHOB|nr:peptide-methionine (R)-S-oxide reductase MsrB [Pacificibacter maritimus]RPE66436.1 peptide-methionine (R)-S-oxide reductase [Pacificibacter maritimus]